MEFKKIDDNKFQCLLLEEDLEDNDITLDDFFRNDTDKIHNLLEVVMEEAAKNIDVEMNGGVMSLQLAPQPDHSILLTVSSGKDDFGNMLRQVGERAAKAFSSYKPDDTKGNVIKNPGDEAKAAEFTAFDKIKDIFDEMKNENNNSSSINPDSLYNNNNANGKHISKVVTVGFAVYSFDSFEDFEQMCYICPKIWGVPNSLYKKNDMYYLVLEKGRCSKDRYTTICNVISEYGKIDSDREERVLWIKENCETIIETNAVGKMKKLL